MPTRASNSDGGIGELHVVAFQLAAMQYRTDTARLMVWRIGWITRNKQIFDLVEGFTAKLVISETAVYVTDEVIQRLSGNGYTRDYPRGEDAPR